MNTRLWFGPGTFLTRHDDQLPSLSGVHGLKDFLCSAHLLESFDGRIYTYWSFLKSKFVHQRIQEDGRLEKILQTMNSWEWGELIVVCWKICLGASSHSSGYLSDWTVLKIMSLYNFTISISIHTPSDNLIRWRVSTSEQSPIFFYFFTSHLMLLYKTKQLLYSDSVSPAPILSRWCESVNGEVKYWRL